tara:strand:+ start:5077 stop:6192 length:1116 start_codon:yes stop_codon:yes gene_type:complete
MILMKKTALYNSHIKLGAKILPFSGYEMPIQFSGILNECNAVRKNVGIFDLSHMGEIIIKGKDATKFLQQITTNNVDALKVGKIQYTLICNYNGGIKDDCLLYKFSDLYILVVNATNIEKIFDWLNKNSFGEVTIENKSNFYSLIAIQGPKSLNLMFDVTNKNKKLKKLKYYSFMNLNIDNVDVFCSRTGYTGEKGFEIYVQNKYAKKIWDIFLTRGKSFNLEPIGLAARDTLRIEMKYCLYGSEINEDINPIQAGLKFVVDFKKNDFIGKNEILKFYDNNQKKVLRGIVVNGNAIPRKSAPIFKNNEKIGYVTSGTYSPALKKSIGIIYIIEKYGLLNEDIDVEIRNKKFSGKIIKTPFLKSNCLTLNYE